MGQLVTPVAAKTTTTLEPHLSTPKEVKGIYLTAYTVSDRARLASLVALIDRTELNTVVIDIKDYSGHLLYDSHVPLTKELGLSEPIIKDVPALVHLLHSHGIYVIARQTVFQDPLLAEKKPDWAMKDIGGGLWHDYKGLSWVDPTIHEVWDYNIAVAREAETLGFDEINFDYIRFPSDGNLHRVASLQNIEKKYQVIGPFYTYLSVHLTPDHVPLSFDLFGFVMERTGDDDLGIGQRLTDAVGQADFIDPMMYPSHYPAGHLGFANPANYPVQVINNGMEKGVPVFAGTRAKPRPWLQAFNLGAVYDGTKIREEIDTAEKYPIAGWLLWNASNHYTADGLKSEAVVLSGVGN